MPAVGTKPNPAATPRHQRKAPPPHPAEQYVADVLAGRIVVCKWVRLAVERHVRDLKDGHLRGLHFDRKAAEHAIKFFGLLRHIEGEWARGAGEPLRLEPFQQFGLWCVFGWKKSDGTRRFKTAYEEEARKNGKTTKSAGVGLYLVSMDDEPGAQVYCLAPETRVLCDDFVWRPVGDMAVGQGLIAFDEEAPAKNKMRKLRRSAVLCADRKRLPCYEIEFTDGRKVVASSLHKWLGRSGPRADRLYWMETSKLRPGARIRDLGIPWLTDNSREAGYLAGIFDGEACFVNRKLRENGERNKNGFRITFAQKPGAVMDRVQALCRDKGFRLNGFTRHRQSGVDYFSIAGFYQCAKFLGEIRPERLLASAQRWYIGGVPNKATNGGSAVVKSVTFVGEREVVAISTETETLFAEGLFSHNTAATKMDQARITHRTAIGMVRKSPPLSRRIEVFKDNLSITETASRFLPLGADAKTLDGLNVHGAIVDEVHEHPSSAVFDVLDTATAARRQPLIWMITTAGADETSFCYRMHGYSKRILEGTVEDDSFWCIIYTIDEGDDWEDESCWIKANPNLGVSVKIDDLRRKAEKAKALPSERNNFLRKHLNVWTRGEILWLPVEKWNACAELPDASELVGLECVGGLDLANSLDLAAFVLLFAMGKDEYAALPLFWVPEDRLQERERRNQTRLEPWVQAGFIKTTPGDETDYATVRQDINDLCSSYRVREIAFDPWNAKQFSQDLTADGFNVVEFTQSKLNFTEPCKKLEQIVLAGKLRHGGHPVLRWMASNVVLEINGAGNMMPARKKCVDKIDGIMALLMALGRFIVEPEAGEGGVEAW